MVIWKLKRKGNGSCKPRDLGAGSETMNFVRVSNLLQREILDEEKQTEENGEMISRSENETVESKQSPLT